MNTTHYLKILCCMVMAGVLSACGGGDSGGSITPAASPPPTSGIDRTGVSMGSIDGFGSIIVNAKRWDTDSAAITVDNSPGEISDLAVGDVVTIVGTIDNNGNATATTVAANDAVEGPITSIDLMAATLVVLGQTVIIDAGTSFDDDISPPDLTGLSVGDVVEVHGLFTANGEIRATRIERELQPDEFELNGVVGSHDATAQTFVIGMQLVDYSNAILSDFDSGMIADGDLVEVKGLSLGANGELLATSVERKDFGVDDFDGDDGDELEIEGFVTSFTSSTDFAVSGVPVTTVASTEFEDGSAADLALDVRVEVEGVLDANGVLVASKVEFEDEEPLIEIAAQVDSTDGAAGTLVILGIEVATDLSTRFEDKTDPPMVPFNVTHIVAGDYVEVRGSLDPDNPARVLATRIERDEQDSEVELQGPVESVAEPMLSILGVTVETNASTEFESADDQPLSATAFFGQVDAGDLVKVEGTESSATVIIADEVEFED